jgi:hypothetical protein
MLKLSYFSVIIHNFFDCSKGEDRMRFRAISIAVVSTIVCLSTRDVPAQAGTVLAATAISTDMGTRNNGSDIENVINQSGLSPGYTSGVTDFATYTGAALESHDYTSYVWQSNFITTGDIIFKLGASETIAAFALWNGESTYGVEGFTLLASNNSSFTDATTLGTFTAAPGATDTGASVPPELAQVFNFTATTAKYVKMEITSNHGGNFTEVDEAAFEQVAAVVPEPGSIVMMTTGATGALLFWRRRGIGKRSRTAGLPS